MGITPLDISSKEFSSRFKGYDRDEVDDFLDRIVLEMESLTKEKRDLEKKIKFMSEQVEHYMSLQDTLNKSIVVAQEAADRLIGNAEKEAEIILGNAKHSATELVSDAKDKADHIASETETLKRAAAIFRKKFQLLVESQLELIQNEVWESLLGTEAQSAEEVASTPVFTESIETEQY